MGNSRTMVPKGPARHHGLGRPSGSAPTHALLELQRQAGNRAVTQLVRGGAGHPAAALLPVQRVGEGGLALAPPPLLSERQRMASEAGPLVQQEVGGLPELGSKGPDESQAKDAAREAEVMSQEGPKDLPDDPAFLAWVDAQNARPPIEDQKAELQELQTGKEEASGSGSEGTFAPELFEQPRAKPGRLARAGQAVGGFFRGVGRGIASGLSSAGRSIQGGLSRAGTAVKGGLSRAGREIKGAFTGTNLRDKGQIGIATGGGVAKEVAKQAAQSDPTAFENPADLAQSVASGGVELVHAIATLVGLFFSALKGAFDLKSLVSSVRIVKALKKVRAEALEQAQSLIGPNEDAEKLVAMIDYAIRQKYEKIIKRAIAASIAFATVGAALAVLIANPVGASVAALVLGTAGLALSVYKLGRYIWKRHKESKGKQRFSMAFRLHEQVRQGEPLAIDAVRALHLDPNKVAKDANGVSQIARKLKSA